MSNQNQPNEKRRAMVKKIALLGAAIISSPFVITPSRGASRAVKKGAKQRIIIRTAGGNIQKYYTDHLFKPFYKETGIEVIGVSSKVEPTTEIKTMVENKNYIWNMSCLSHRAVHFLGKDYLEPHKLERDPIISTIMPPFVTPYGVGMDVYALVLAYRTDVFDEKKGLEAPKTWQDFWNVQKFPGRRALRKVPFDTIEEALLADGALPSEVYPCDLKRAFLSLDRIKPHIPVWWQNAPDAGNLLTTGEVDLMPAFVVNVLFALDAKAPVAFSWDQHMRGCDNWAILKGTPNADACREFIKFASHPERQAQLAKYGVAPSQPKAFDYIDPEYFKFLSTYPDNFKKGLFSDALYWTKNQHFVTERFNQWMIS